MIKFFTIFFLCLLNAAAFCQTDAQVDAVYTLGKIPAPLGVYNHIVQAKIINAGVSPLTNLPITLTVTGSNIFSNTQIISINPGEATLVSFNAFSPWNTGTNIITVTVPSDDNNANNSAAYTQLVNNNIFSYADASMPVSSIGFGTGEGMLLAKFQASGSGIVKQVRAHIGTAANCIGRTVYAVVASFGVLLGQSLPHIITAADLGTYVVFDIVEQPLTDAEAPMFVGLVQLSDGTTEYYPLSYQAEGTPTRPDAYFASLTDGSGLTELNYIGRLMLEAVVDIGTDAPFNSVSSSTTNSVIAGWDLSGANSPATFAATTFDTSLVSSNLLTRGPGAGASTGLHSFRTTGFQNDGIATSNSDYFQVTLSVKQGDTLSLSSLNAFVHGNNSNITNLGVSSQFAYSLDGINFTLIGSPVLTTRLVESISTGLSGIPSLQNITTGTTVTIRYYASGEAAVSDWGILSARPGSNALAVNGRLAHTNVNSVLTAPVVPTGADFNLGDCNGTATGSISFTSSGTFSSNNQYRVQLGKIVETQQNFYSWTSPVTIGSLNSTSNSGTINFTIPAGTNDDEYAIRIISTQPFVSGTLSQKFAVRGRSCRSLPAGLFRSRASGDWTDINTWETKSPAGSTWIQATLIPNELSAGVEIKNGDLVTVTSNISVKKMDIKGTLKLLNGVNNKGKITLLAAPFPGPFSLIISKTGTFQVASAGEVYNDVMLLLDGVIRVYGRITIGDGTNAVARGFESFAADQSVAISWNDASVFEWNCNTPFVTNGASYFSDNSTYPTLRLTKIPAVSLGGNDNTVINGLLEINTPVTWAGTGTKTFTAGVKGSSVITQAAGCGKFFTTAPFQDLPVIGNSNSTVVGIIGGNLAIQLNTEGFTFTAGITVPEASNVSILGPCLSLRETAVQQTAVMTLGAGARFTIENGDFVNEGSLQGPGTLEFTGGIASLLTTPGLLTAPLVLTNKQLSLGSNASTAAISLTASSNLLLERFNLNMGTASLLADAANFIVTNDTGRLSRFVSASPVNFPIGVSSNTYTPVNISNAGNPDNIKAGVIIGVQSTVPVTNGNVDRTWIIGDSTQTGANLSLTLQWNAGDEQPGFDRTRCYISHYTSCPSPASCTPFFDAVPEANCTGSTSFTIQRNSIADFYTPKFIVSSRQFAFTFTGNGDWNNAANWTPAVVAPVVISPGIEVYIDPAVSGECIYNGNIKIKQGGKLKVQPGKRLTVTGDITVE